MAKKINKDNLFDSRNIQLTARVPHADGVNNAGGIEVPSATATVVPTANEALVVLSHGDRF